MICDTARLFGNFWSFRPPNTSLILKNRLFNFWPLWPDSTSSFYDRAKSMVTVFFGTFWPKKTIVWIWEVFLKSWIPIKLNLAIAKQWFAIWILVNINSLGTEIFTFSYFAFTSLKMMKVIKDIKNINIFHKTRVHGLDFGRESFYRNHHMTPW